jgi:hypothetical protein
MGGIFMVVFSFLYPLEKRQKIELEINLYNKQIELLNEEILSLNKDVNKLKENTKETFSLLERQKSEKDENIAKQKIKEIQEQYNKAFFTTKAKENEVITKNIILKYEKEKIGLLENQVNSFTIFQWILLIMGSLFTFFGLWNWNKTTKISSEMQVLELYKKRKENK